MDTKTKESTKTRPLFDKACQELNYVLNAGEVHDKDFVAAVLQVFTGHIKVLNSERATDALKFAVAQSTASNSEEVKSIIKKSLPEYTVSDAKV